MLLAWYAVTCIVGLTGIYCVLYKLYTLNEYCVCFDHTHTHIYIYTHYVGWRIKNSLLSPPPVSVGSVNVQWSLSPHTLFLITECIGLMAIQATEFNKNRVQIA